MQLLRALGRRLGDRLRRHTSDGRYRPEIDGLRFFAIALVVFGHLAERCLRSVEVDGLLHADERSFLVAVGHTAWRGVLLFFTISGFIISTQFLKREESALSPSFLRRYFSRRVLRIEPPYFIVLIATFAFVSLTHYVPPEAVSFSGLPHSMTVSLLASLAYAHGLLFGTFPRLFPPGWSLEMEIQFYVLAPLVFWLFFSIRKRAVRTAVGVAAFGLILFAASYTPSSDHAPFVQLSIIRNAPYFWLGILLADWQGAIRAALAKHAFVGSLAGWIGAVTIAVVDGGSAQPFEAMITSLCTLLSILAMFLGALAMQNSFSKFCSAPFVAITGGQCYSIYLTHLQPMQVMTPIVVKLGHIASPMQAFLMTSAIEIPVILAASTLFYVLVERPFMTDNWPSRLYDFLVCAMAKRRVTMAAEEPADLT